jgi:hypothetical protein
MKPEEKMRQKIGKREISVNFIYLDATQRAKPNFKLKRIPDIKGQIKNLIQ